MRFEEVVNILSDINFSENLSDGKNEKGEYIELHDTYAFKQFIAMPVSVVAAQIGTNSVNTTLEDLDEIEILDDGNQTIGWLYLCKNHEVGTIGALSDPKFIAFLNDADTVAFQALNSHYTMKLNYLVLNEANYADYLQRYMKSSPLWGGFAHHTNPTSSHKMITKQIIAIRDLKFPTLDHEERIIRSVEQLYAFERFLNQYHLLEMLFDWQLVKNIRKEPGELEAIQKFKEYTGKDFSSELDRLFIVIKSGVVDVEKLAKQLNTIVPPSGDKYFLDRAREIFFNDKIKNDGKNPFQSMNYDKFEVEIAGKLEETNKYFNNKSFEEKIIRLTAYWIYQVRNAIVHRKLGEYFIADIDEQFIVEFMEPLLKEVLCQVFLT